VKIENAIQPVQCLAVGVGRRAAWVLGHCVSLAIDVKRRNPTARPQRQECRRREKHFRATVLARNANVELS
jgi:hypothetical protein